MQSNIIDDRRYYASGIAARHIGTRVDVYRPGGTTNPLGPAYRYLRMNAAFEPARGGLSRSAERDAAEWHGIFDASYTAPGDYLVAAERVFFIASQWPLLPVLCIRTNRLLAAVRPAQQSGLGSNAYGGYLATEANLLFSGWPASVLGISAGSDAGDGLPVKQAVPLVTILLPRVPTVVLSPGDIVSDDLDRTMVVTVTELTELGWRLTARLASA